MHGAIEPEQDLVKLAANDVQQYLCELYETAPLQIATSSPQATGTSMPIDNDKDVDALHATLVRRSKRLAAKKSKLKALEQKMKHWDNAIHRRIPAEVEEEEDVIDEERDSTWQPSRRERSPRLTATIVAEHRSDLAQEHEHLRRQHKQFRKEYEKAERRLNEARQQWQQARDKSDRHRRWKAKKQRQASRQIRARDEKMIQAFKAEAIAKQKRVQEENQARSRAQEEEDRARRSLAQKEDRARARGQLGATGFAAQQAHRTKLVQERKLAFQSYGASPKKAPGLSGYKTNANATDKPLSRPHPARRPK
jgi:DNA repair exonuclease SbcCD ATPase subunit